LLRDIPRWAEGNFTEYRRPLIIVGSAGTQPQMAPTSDLESNLESDSVEIDVEITQLSPRTRSRPQGNRAAKEDHKNMKLRNAAIKA
jgi:hypothetical protein